jgi:trehalose 6-phosphate phosphatase
MMLESILSPTGLERHASLARARPLIAFDFDGTLAPIQDRPDEVRIDAPLALRLGQLAALAPVAIITGRRVDDVRPRLGFAPVAILGNHGAEDPDDHRAATRWADALAPLRLRLSAWKRELRQAGVVVEDKGQSIALHHRLAASPATALETIDRVLEALPQRVLRHAGKDVVNIVAADAPDKAVALRTLLQRRGCSAAFFAGDDANDEPVFEAAADDWVTIKVGAEGRTAAGFGLANPDAMLEVVDRLLEALR